MLNDFHPEGIKPNVHQGDQLHILLTMVRSLVRQQDIEMMTMVVVDNAKNLLAVMSI